MNDSNDVSDRPISSPPLLSPDHDFPTGRFAPTGSSNIRQRAILINVGLLTVSIIFTLLVSEMVLRLVGFTPMLVSPERDRFWKYDALLGWVHQPGQEGIFEMAQFRTSLHINQKGLRGREYPYERTSDAGRILVLGDSFAWGYGVEESERFSELLANSMDAEVINAGVSGYSTDQELLWFRNEGVKYDPDLVILVLAGNDIGDNYRNIVYTIYYKPRFVLEGDLLTLEGYPVPKASSRARTIYFLSQRSALAHFLVQRYFDLLSIYNDSRANAVKDGSQFSESDSTRAPFKVTIALLDEMRKLAESKRVKFMIVATDAWWNSPSVGTYEEFIDTLKANGFLVLDVESMAGFDAEAMKIPDDGHWNRFGHAFVARRIQDFIEDNELLMRQRNATTWTER